MTIDLPDAVAPLRAHGLKVEDGWIFVTRLPLEAWEQSEERS